jgi:hypothetical protein
MQSKGTTIMHNQPPKDAIELAFKNGMLGVMSLPAIGALAGAAILTLTPRVEFEEQLLGMIAEPRSSRKRLTRQVKESVRRQLQTAMLADDPADQDLHNDLTILFALCLADKHDRGDDGFWAGTGLERQGLKLLTDFTLPRDERGRLSASMEEHLGVTGEIARLDEEIRRMSN